MLSKVTFHARIAPVGLTKSVKISMHNGGATYWTIFSTAVLILKLELWPLLWKVDSESWQRCAKFHEHRTFTFREITTSVMNEWMNPLWRSICFLGRPKGGLLFYRRCFLLLLFRHAFSEVPRPIALKLCHMVEIWPNFIIPLQNFGGAPPKKFGAKNMENFGQFWTTLEFDRKYLWNGWRYPKSADVTNYGNSSCV